jgi:hypothetical protein
MKIIIIEKNKICKLEVYICFLLKNLCFFFICCFLHRGLLFIFIVGNIKKKKKQGQRDVLGSEKWRYLTDMTIY